MPTPTPDELPNPEQAVIDWQAERLARLGNENGKLKAQLHHVAELALYVISDTTPAGMDSDQERELRKLRSEILGAKG